MRDIFKWQFITGTKEDKFNKYIILIGLTAIYTRVLSQLIIILYLYDFIKIYTCRKVTIGVTRSCGSKDRHYSGQTKIDKP